MKGKAGEGWDVISISALMFKQSIFDSKLRKKYYYYYIAMFQKDMFPFTALALGEAFLKLIMKIKDHEIFCFPAKVKNHVIFILQL